MKKINYIVLLAIGVALASCRKEETLTFQDYDKNWLALEDNANDATLHSNYLFYKETGIPVFINDTIGSQPRVDVYGKNYIHYQKLSLSYSLGGIQTGARPMVLSFTYCKKTDVPAALAYLKSDILPVIPKKVYVPSILLVENLNTVAFGSYAFKGLNTVVIGGVSTIPTMSATTKMAYKGAILRAMLTNAVFDKKYSELLDKFYAVSRKYVVGKDVYTGIYIYQITTAVTGLPAGTTATPQAIGFIGTDPRNPYYTPMSDWIDVCVYLETILGTTDAEFKQRFAASPNILLKYGYIKQILTDIGVNL
ncbi:hypothetical protein [Nubsella zeaxanthinifaciens]|uniref:hypothetical protein n=1 Tax=Nubsella zeaxanthinifaciens TaxID=392412 RepID=UPI000DE24C6E|nr:hypothetical protein [Nubsella zeaxanthinifaciens]